MKVGALLRIKPEYRNPGETDETIYRCVEDNRDRLVIELANSDLPLNPQEVVPSYCVTEIAEESLTEGARGIVQDKLNTLPEVVSLHKLLLRFKAALDTESGESVKKFVELAEQNKIDFNSRLLNMRVNLVGDTEIAIYVEGDNGPHDLLPFINDIHENKIAPKLVRAYSVAMKACQDFIVEAETANAEDKANRAMDRIRAKYDINPDAEVKALTLSKDTLNWLFRWISTISVQVPDVPEIKAYFKDLTGIDPDTYTGKGLGLVKMTDANGKVKRTASGALMKFNISSNASLYPEHTEVPTELLPYYNETKDAFTANELITDTLLSAYGDTFTLGKQAGIPSEGEATIADASSDIDEAFTFEDWYKYLSKLNEDTTTVSEPSSSRSAIDIFRDYLKTAEGKRFSSHGATIEEIYFEEDIDYFYLRSYICLHQPNGTQTRPIPKYVLRDYLQNKFKKGFIEPTALKELWDEEASVFTAEEIEDEPKYQDWYEPGDETPNQYYWVDAEWAKKDINTNTIKNISVTFK